MEPGQAQEVRPQEQVIQMMLKGKSSFLFYPTTMKSMGELEEQRAHSHLSWESKAEHSITIFSNPFILAFKG